MFFHSFKKWSDIILKKIFKSLEGQNTPMEGIYDKLALNQEPVSNVF